MRRSKLTINIKKYKHNIINIRNQLQPTTSIMMIIKANGYGFGADVIATAAEEENIDYFAVACLNEAIKLRESGIKTPILILSQPAINESEDIIKYNLTQTITSLEYGKRLAKAAIKHNKQIPIHVKVDTGMNRIGIRYEEAEVLIKDLSKLNGVLIEGIYSHLTSSEEENNPFNKNQIELFTKLIKKIDIKPRYIHIANSEAISNFPESHLSMIRIGLKGYQNILQLESHIIEIKQVKKGESISYNQTYKTNYDTEIAIVPVGYGDGIPGELSNCGFVKINKKYKPIRGKVCMDYIIVELGKDHTEKVGDKVTIIDSNEMDRINLTAISQLINKNERELCLILGNSHKKEYIK